MRALWLVLTLSLTGCVLPAKWEGPEVIHKSDGGTMVCQRYREYGPDPVERWMRCPR